MTVPTKIQFIKALVTSPLFRSEAGRYFPYVGDGLLYDAPEAVAKELGCDDYHKIYDYDSAIESAIDTVFKEMRNANGIKADVDSEIKKFSALQGELAALGASDSEVNRRFERILNKADRGEPIYLHAMDADWWGLFLDLGREDAARALTAQARIIYNAILENKKV